MRAHAFLRLFPGTKYSIGPPIVNGLYYDFVVVRPFTPDDLCHAVRDALSRAADLTAAAEQEIACAHAGLSRLALALEASRTMRVHTQDLVVAARALRRMARST